MAQRVDLRCIVSEVAGEKKKNLGAIKVLAYSELNYFVFKGRESALVFVCTTKLAGKKNFFFLDNGARVVPQCRG